MTAAWTGRRVLVTGGAGFLGSHLVEHLVSLGARVRVADDLSRGRLENLAGVRADAEFLRLDLRDRDAALRACEGEEWVFHLAAAITGIGYSFRHHAELFDTNMLLLQNGLHAAHRHGVARFCQVSSACVYPADAVVPTPEREAERGAPEPANAGYGWAKRMGEVLAGYYATETGMRVVVARPFNAYGPRDHFDEARAHVIPALIRKVLDGPEPVTVWGSGTQTRSFLHARDVVRAMRLLLERCDRADPVNIGHEEEIPIRRLVERIQAEAGVRREVRYDPAMPEGYQRRAADGARLREITGFAPAIPLDAGLAETIAWYRSTRTDRSLAGRS